MSSDGMPAVPKPPIITVAPSGDVRDRGRGAGNDFVDHGFLGELRRAVVMPRFGNTW